MHPRNPYKSPPDFVVLANGYPALKPYLRELSHGFTINYKDEAAQRTLTEALLYCHFGWTVHVHPQRLCPPIPNRLNYIMWIQDIVRANSIGNESDCEVVGLDVGTGCIAIYPLLACKLEDKWRFVATELDDISFRHAQETVQANELNHRIRVTKVDSPQSILSWIPLTDQVFDFSMCNPPFYTSASEVASSAAAKLSGPNAVCTGADVEMVTDGGEVGFVSRMIQESEHVSFRCKWFTSMLGKVSSLTQIIQLFRDRAVTNYAITEFIQGQTHRWAVAWSYTSTHLPDAISRIPNPTLLHLMPPRTTLDQEFTFKALPTPNDCQVIIGRVLSATEGIVVNEVSSTNLNLRGLSGTTPLVASAMRNTWSRSARRQRRMVVDEAPLDASANSKPPSPFLVCSMRWMEGTRRRNTPLTEQKIALQYQWIHGDDRSAFESFASHISRKVGALWASCTGP